MTSLTTTSYAILGLLSHQPYTAYELAAQSQRSLRFTWPTAESRLYAEPKRLAEAGLIEIEHEPAGPTRTRQRYRITDAGTSALREWLGTVPAPPRAEFEFLLRVMFGDAGDAEHILDSLQATRQQATELYEDGREMLFAYRDRGVAFPERMHLNMVWIVFMSELLQLIIDWTDFAEGEVASQPSPGDMGETRRAHEILNALLDNRPVLPERGPPAQG